MRGTVLAITSGRFQKANRTSLGAASRRHRTRSSGPRLAPVGEREAERHWSPVMSASISMLQPGEACVVGGGHRLASARIVASVGANPDSSGYEQRQTAWGAVASAGGSFSGVESGVCGLHLTVSEAAAAWASTAAPAFAYALPPTAATSRPRARYGSFPRDRPRRLNPLASASSSALSRFSVSRSHRRDTRSTSEPSRAAASRRMRRRRHIGIRRQPLLPLCRRTLSWRTLEPGFPG